MRSFLRGLSWPQIAYISVLNVASIVILVATVTLIVLATGCNQQRERPWPHEPTPDHWMENVWLDEDEAIAKRKWEAANPPEDIFDAATR